MNTESRLRAIKDTALVVDFRLKRDCGCVNACKFSLPMCLYLNSHHHKNILSTYVYKMFAFLFGNLWYNISIKDYIGLGLLRVLREDKAL